tara:strand:+ start:540 stop:872 length:333 start_codon:yes stop_codon:yes gene_type:complete
MQVTAVVTLRIGEPGQYELLAPGSTLMVSKDDAEMLVKKGLARVDGSSAVCDLDERQDAIIDTISELGEAAFGKDGKPHVKAIEDILGQDISAAERDMAWERYQRLHQNE